MNKIIFEKPALLLVGGQKHKLLSDWIVTFRGEEYRVPMEFITDGASIPFWLQPICGDPNKVPRVYAALMHDWLYSGGDPEATRAEADDLYRDMQIALGVPRWKAYVEWTALRIFGRSHWRALTKAAMIAAALVVAGCRTVTVERTWQEPVTIENKIATTEKGEVILGDRSWTVKYLMCGLSTEMESMEAIIGNITLRFGNVRSDMSQENAKVVESVGSAVGEVAEKVIEGVK